jgi:hypothetical protein
VKGPTETQPSAPQKAIPEQQAEDVAVPDGVHLPLEDVVDATPITGRPPRSCPFAVPSTHVAEGNDGMTSALASVELSTQALPNGWNGTGIGVRMNDGDGKPMTSSSCVDTSDLTLPT